MPEGLLINFYFENVKFRRRNLNDRMVLALVSLFGSRALDVICIVK